jgi:hypothetical protein
MVFMSAQHVPGEAVPLLDEAKADIAEMEKAMAKAMEEAKATGNKPHDNVRILYQLHGEGVPERCQVGEKGSKEPVPDGLRDNTGGEALIGFIDWALRKADHRSNYRSMLVLWGHAYRFGFSPAVTKSGIDAMDFEELSRVLTAVQAAFQPYYESDTKPKLDIIGFDACDLATVEMAVQLQEFADYLLASQVGIPLPGWPYDRVLDRLATPEGRLMGPAEFGSYVVRRYCESYKAPGFSADGTDKERAVSLTLLDLKQAPRLFELAESLARELALALNASSEELSLVVELFLRSQTAEDKPFVDVADLCLNLCVYSRSVDVRSAAERLGNLLISPAPVEPGKSVSGDGRPLIVEHGRNAVPTARLNGISLYAPHVASGHDPATASHWYEKFSFAKQTLWNDLVRALAQPT